jgi:pimeloyl-ACP methyl ester carboxylesterase
MRYVRRYPEELPVLAELLPQITTPVTLINGRHDRVVPLANVEYGPATEALKVYEVHEVDGSIQIRA